MSADLRAKLLELGSSNQLFTIKPGTDCDLYLEHNIVDAEYYGIASKEDVRKRYGAKLWLVDNQQTVKYREIIEEKTASAGVLPAPKLTMEKSFFKGKVLFKKEKEVAFGFKKPLDPSSFGKVYQYDFDVEKIRKPVRELVQSEGWKFEQIITDYHPLASQQKYCSQFGGPLPSSVVFCTNCGQKLA